MPTDPSLADELDFLRKYVAIEQARFQDRLTVTFEIARDTEDCPVPNFLLQPLVENAIRHGLEPVVAGGRIEVQARAEGPQLLLTVHDNGCGISELALAESVRPLMPDTDQSGTSWGLSHVRQRLHTLYGERSTIHISPVPTGGTSVVLTLPLEIFPNELTPSPPP